MDIPGGKRIVHAISIGSPKNIHYTYDLENGGLVQVWRGNFLDGTPMWYSRGDGSSRPLGTVQYFGNPVSVLSKLNNADAEWTIDSALANYTPQGYRLDKTDLPTFQYLMYGAQVEDAIIPMEKGEGFKREITLKNSPGNIYLRLAVGTGIEAIGSNMYTINDKAYYIRIDDAGSAKPVIRYNNAGKELIIPVGTKITYSILF